MTSIVQAGNFDGCVQIDTDSMIYAPPGPVFDIEVSAQALDTDFYVACRDDGLSLMTVGGFSAG